MDDLDRTIINGLQGGFPISETPYADAAADLGTTEEVLLEHLDDMLENGVLSRFGPLFDVEAMGGAVTLCAMSIPDKDFERIAGLVNGYREVAHNYERNHRLNMWFVVSAQTRDGIDAVLGDIEKRTGLTVFDMPKQEEFFIGLRLEA